MEFVAKGITIDELSNLFECATYNNNALYFGRAIKKGKAYKSGKYKSDAFAAHLLAGGDVTFWDLYAEADTLREKHSNNGIRVDKGDGSIEYRINLTDVLDGFGVALKACPRCLSRFLEGDEDQIDCWCIMQCILFGELIYG